MTKIFGYGRLEDDVATLLAGVAVSSAMTGAMGVLTETGGTLTTDGNEQTIYLNNSPAGVFEPKCVKVETSNQTATETIVIREYYRLSSGGALILHDEETYEGAIDMEEITVRLDPNRFGAEVTIEKTAGTNRDYLWEVIYEV